MIYTVGGATERVKEALEELLEASSPFLCIRIIIYVRNRRIILECVPMRVSHSAWEGVT